MSVKYVIDVDSTNEIILDLIEDRLRDFVDEIDQLLGDGPARTRWYINEDA
jgi:hypothetical protein